MWRLSDGSSHVVNSNGGNKLKARCCREAASLWDGRSLWWKAFRLSLLLIWWLGSLWSAKDEEIVSQGRLFLTFHEVRSLLLKEGVLPHERYIAWLWTDCHRGKWRGGERKKSAHGRDAGGGSRAWKKGGWRQEGWRRGLGEKEEWRWAWGSQ